MFTCIGEVWGNGFREIPSLPLCLAHERLICVVIVLYNRILGSSNIWINVYRGECFKTANRPADTIYSIWFELKLFIL